jgi:hypothetical protein
VFASISYLKGVVEDAGEQGDDARRPALRRRPARLRRRRSACARATRSSSRSSTPPSPRRSADGTVKDDVDEVVRASTSRPPSEMTGPRKGRPRDRLRRAHGASAPRAGAC